MADKIIVTPNEVRGLGNILEPRVRTSFFKFYCDILDGASAATIDNISHTYFHMQLLGEEISVSMDLESVPVYGTEQEVTVTVVTADNESPIQDSDVRLWDMNQNIVLDTIPTNSSGVAVFDWTPTESDFLNGYYIRAEVLSQGQYAEGEAYIMGTAGLPISISQILLDVELDTEEDEYVLTYGTIDSRAPLENGFVRDVSIGNNGEVVVDYAQLSDDHTQDEAELLFGDDLSLLYGAVKEVYQGENEPVFYKERFSNNYSNFTEEED